VEIFLLESAINLQKYFPNSEYGTMYAIKNYNPFTPSTRITKSRSKTIILPMKNVLDIILKLKNMDITLKGGGSCDMGDLSSVSM